MAEPDSKEPITLAPRKAEPDPTVEPSWKPLLWLAGSLTVIIALGEVFFELLLDLLETLGEAVFFAVEGSEELLEDKIEEWFDLDPYHAEIVTAWSMTPLKLLLAFLLLRWLWRMGRTRLFPRVAAYGKRQYASVGLAWQELAWPYKVLLAAGILGGLLILI